MDNIKHPILMIASVILAIIAIYVIRSSTGLFEVFYTLQLFGTLIHEIGHSFAAIITGGQSHGFVVNANSGGYAQISGGFFPLISMAGYVGTAFWGSLLFYLNNRYRLADFLAFGVGAFILAFTVIFGKPEDNGQRTALNLAMLFGILLMVSGATGRVWLNIFIVNVLSVNTALEGFFRARSLYHLSEDWHHNDAVMFAKEVTPWLTGNQVALIWAAISLLMLATAFYFGVWKVLRHKGQLKWKYFTDKKTYVEA